MVDIDLSYGMKSVWDTDRDYQLSCIEGIIGNVRAVEDSMIKKMHVGYLVDQGAFFVHNHDYMIKHFGESIKNIKYGLYNLDGLCSLAGRLAIPIRMFDGTVRGFIGYSSKPRDYDPEAIFIKYLYPPKTAFNKGRFFYISRDEYVRAINDGYVCIVDGIFDKIILQCMGINAVSLCGSSLTEWHQRYLSFIRNKIVIADNDIAGRKLASYCRYKLDNCVELQQSETGDIDSLVRSEKWVKVFRDTFSTMKNEGFLVSKEIPKIIS